MWVLTRAIVFGVLLLTFAASQVFWIRRISQLFNLLVRRPFPRRLVSAIALLVYFGLLIYNFGVTWRSSEPTRLTVSAALLEAPFRLWFFGSVLGFLLILMLRIIDHAVRLFEWTIHRLPAVLSRGKSNAGYQVRSREQPQSSGAVDGSGAIGLSRRRFLEKTAVAVGSAPFFAGAYGLLYGRLNLELTHQPIRLTRLPKSFHGFRIAQLSDIHIGPFMPSDEIRKYVEIANGLKPDLVVLTGDFVTWDPDTQEDAVRALSGLKAPFGVFGCLGNHEMWTETQESITALFAAQGTRILRSARASVQSGGDFINLIGVDYQTSRRRIGPHREEPVGHYLRGIEPLVAPGTANILLSHNPNSFDRAAELNIDLSLAGHTHGGQITLEFVNRNLTPSKLITNYVKGWFGKPGGQLYVNRGIGTIGVPIRLNAPPEITVFELQS